ncbi:MAG: metalloregulator ArsR/SmtB family transcription factor [Neisseria sp.]|nr:metalloregulator ArsR/SmtB family transcription factor [Neisseria sp.]
MRNAEHVAEMLKLMAHPHRLMILCLLAESERNVTELVDALHVNQTAVSNHLSKLRSAGIIDYTRYHRVLQYRLNSPEARTILEVLSTFCLNR